MTVSPETGVVNCHVCGREVPAGEFCGACGSHLPSADDAAADRRHAYAADPHEHVMHLSVVSTLFPHLPHRRGAPFRLALALTALALVVFGLLRLTGPAIAVASFAVPIVYLVYLYEVEVYGDEPIGVVASTFVLGALLGIPWSLFVAPLVSGALVMDVVMAQESGRILLAGALVPIAAQLVMLSGALVVYVTRRHLDEVLDGFVFGAATALGFTLSTTLIDLLPELSDVVSPLPPLASAFEVIQRGLLEPYLNAGTVGLIAGALWLRRTGRTRSGLVTLPVAVAVALTLQVAVGLVAVTIADTFVVTAVSAIAVAVVLLWDRLAIHEMLLAEAEHVGIGPVLPCSHCHRSAPRMAFCPQCGIATGATPKTGAGRIGRTMGAS